MYQTANIFIAAYPHWTQTKSDSVFRFSEPTKPKTGHALCILREIFTKVCADIETELAEFDEEQNHVHLLVNCHPKVSVSNLVNNLKRRIFKNYFTNESQESENSVENDFYNLQAILQLHAVMLNYL